MAVTVSGHRIQEDKKRTETRENVQTLIKALVDVSSC